MTVPDPFVSPAWCLEHRDEILLADSRWSFAGDAHERYLAGHLPGAVFIDVNRDLAAPPAPERGRHPLPDPDAFAATMSAAGIDGSRPVIVYDEQGGVMAARLVWMLRTLGLEAAVLDGGLQAWTGPLAHGEHRADAVEFVARPWPRERIAAADEVARFTGPVIDARPHSRFLGEGDDLDPRAGHIPGARSLPCRDHLDGQGRLRDSDDLRADFESAGVSPGVPFISYCGSGVTACHNLLVAERLGLGLGRLYPGSWSQWAASARPIDVGA